MRIQTALKRLLDNYTKAEKNKEKKPVSYALYKTWRWANTYEKEKKDDGQ
mgnify:CR=1 FL=1